MVMNAVNLAGVTATEHGYRIVPHLRRFWLRMPRVGVARESRRLRGYLRTRARTRLVLRVGYVPRGARNVTTWADGHAVAHHASRGLIVFSLATRPDRAADWAITWRL